MFRTLAAAALASALIPAAASAQVELKFKYVEGRQTTETRIENFTQTLKIMGMDFETKTTTETVTSMVEGKKDADGSLPLEIKVDSMKTEMAIPGGGMFVFDSAKPDDAKTDGPLQFLLDALKRLVGFKQVVHVASDGTAKSVDGNEKLLENIDQLDPQAQAVLKAAAKPETVVREFNERIHRFEPGLVRQGDSWERTEQDSIGGGSVMTAKKKYEYQGTVKSGDKELDKIGVTYLDAKLEFDADANPNAKITNPMFKVESSEGTILFDRNAGIVTESKSKLKLKGTMKIEINGAELDTEVEMVFDTVGTTKAK